MNIYSSYSNLDKAAAVLFFCASLGIFFCALLGILFLFGVTEFRL